MPIGSRPASIGVATVISVTNSGSQSPLQRNEQQTSGEASDPKRVREQKRFLLEPVPKKLPVWISFPPSLFLRGEGENRKSEAVRRMERPATGRHDRSFGYRSRPGNSPGRSLEKRTVFQKSSPKKLSVIS